MGEYKRSDTFTFELAGRTVECVWDRWRRYCGLRWSGGAPETWAYRYYDLVKTDPTRVTQVDVLCAGSLHPKISQADLAFFWDRSEELAEWLKPLPEDLVLRDANDTVVEHLGRLASWPDAPPLTLLSKVLHRKRPSLIPLMDRHILDWYRPITGERTATAAWQPLLRAMRSDLMGPEDEPGQLTLLLAIMGNTLAKELGQSLSQLRLVDIAIWMGNRD